MNQPLGADVVTIGEAMLRLATPLGERVAGADSLEVHVAGAEANVAAALAQLGVPTRWVSSLPDTALGRRVERELAAAGVLLDAVEWTSGRLGIFFADTGTPPRPTQVIYDRAGSTFTEMAGIPAAALAGARIVHVSGITAAVATAGLIGSLLERIDANGVELSVDVNYRSLLWTPGDARTGLAPLLERTTTVICGAADAAEVLEIEGEPEHVVAELRRIWAPRAREVVLTLGAEGCCALTADGRTRRYAAPATTMVDRFGVGDAFAAGLIWGLLQDDLDLGLRAGTALSALKATVKGDFARTTAAELDAALEDDGRAIVR